MSCFVVWMLTIGLIVLGDHTVCAQNFPNKPIRIVTAEPGAGNDFVARLIGRGLSASFGQPVIIDNRGAASGIVAAQTVAKAPTDGYTLLSYNNGIWTLPLMQRVPYDPLKDFAPVTLSARSPNILVVNPSVAAESVKGLIALAKSMPGEINYASGGLGSTPHLAAELFKAMAGVNMVHIPYQSGSAAINDLMAGRVQIMFATAATVAPHLKSGRLRALAVTSAQQSALAPGLLTVSESGLPGYESTPMYGIFAPAKTPEPLINRINHEILQVLIREDARKQFISIGMEVVGSTPQEFASTIESEMSRLGKVIKNAGIRAD